MSNKSKIHNLISKREFEDGVIIKHVKNRSVRVIQHPEKDRGAIIEFRRADCTKEDLHKPHCVDAVVKNKIKLTGMVISDEAAFALLLCLHDYFKRVKEYNL